MNIFVGSLPYHVEEADLRSIFEEYGEVASSKIITDKFTGKSRGFGFIEMNDEEIALKAIQELNGAELDGRTIVVNKSEEKAKSDRPRSGGNFRSGGNNNNRRGGNGGGYNRDRGNSRGGYNNN
ncbi:MAG: RNA-binding protein [Marinilabiliaceae bacterium]|nr:RNA-binding protein [Marinilabiliaceae bacterium]